MTKTRQYTQQKRICFIGLLIIPSIIIFQSCSSIGLTNRNGKDYYLGENNYTKLKGTFIDSTIIDYPKKSNNLNENVYTPCTIEIDPITPNKIQYSYYLNDSLVYSKILKGKFKDGYFIQRTKFIIEFTFGPLLWGPGTQKYAYGITNENNLIELESHGGIAIFIILPFFASGGDFKHEYKRIK